MSDVFRSTKICQVLLVWTLWLRWAFILKEPSAKIYFFASWLTLTKRKATSFDFGFASDSFLETKIQTPNLAKTSYSLKRSSSEDSSQFLQNRSRQVLLEITPFRFQSLGFGCVWVGEAALDGFWEKRPESPTWRWIFWGSLMDFLAEIDVSLEIMPWTSRTFRVLFLSSTLSKQNMTRKVWKSRTWLVQGFVLPYLGIRFAFGDKNPHQELTFLLKAPYIYDHCSRTKCSEHSESCFRWCLIDLLWFIHRLFALFLDILHFMSHLETKIHTKNGLFFGNCNLDF